MNSGIFWGIFTVIGAATGATIAIHTARHVQAKQHAFEEARRLSQGKGIVNIGAGPHRTFGAQVIAEQPEVLANIDITPNGIPHFIQLDIERELLPFIYKQFGCAFASHILEHLDNWQFALEEACRVADNVVVVLPHPCSFGGWLNPEHRQHFSPADIDNMLTLHPNVIVYY